MTQIDHEPLRNALGTIQALYNFLEASPKRPALFTDTEVQDEDLKLMLKSLSTTRWSCRWEDVKAVYGQMKYKLDKLQSRERRSCLIERWISMKI